jgi:histidine triad (HIT) family protein
VFCKIARGEEQASLVYEDKNVVAFLDMRPVNEGHTLVVTRKHYENIYLVPDEELSHLFRVVKRVAIAIAKSEKAGGISIVQNNGRGAHQVVFHLHVHVIPRYENLEARRPREVAKQDGLDRVAARIRGFI